MYLNPDTTAILVADRRSARELAASRHRSVANVFRRAATTRTPVALFAAPIGRTPVETACRAA